MAHYMAPEFKWAGKGKFANAKGNTECVEFVRQAANLPPTTLWSPGPRVADTGPGGIPQYTAIATFDDKRAYRTDGKGRHAAIYLSHDEYGILVLDQWNKQGEVKQRTIRFESRVPVDDSKYSRSNDGSTFYVIEVGNQAFRLDGNAARAIV